MKPLNPTLTAHLQQSVTTLATAYRLTRRDRQQHGFTSLDKDITIDGLLYKSSNSLNASSIEQTTDFRANTLDVQGVLSDESITADDLLSGLYDGALVDIFLFNHQSPPVALIPENVVWILTARIAEVRVWQNTFVAELRSLADTLQTSKGDVYSPTCRVQRLGDERCRVTLTGYTHTDTVATVTDARTFTHSASPQANDYFTHGIVRFTSGANAGREQVVKQYRNGVIELVDPLPKTLLTGDNITLIRGCDRRFATCRDVFDNVANFRGEPPHLLPGTDKILRPL